MAIRIDVLDNNRVELFNDGEDVPFFYQDSWPDGRVWTDANEARLWAEGYVNMLETGEPFSPNDPVA